jgi:hypothetical protein
VSVGGQRKPLAATLVAVEILMEMAAVLRHCSEKKSPPLKENGST